MKKDRVNINGLGRSFKKKFEQRQRERNLVGKSVQVQKENELPKNHKTWMSVWNSMLALGSDAMLQIKALGAVAMVNKEFDERGNMVEVRYRLGYHFVRSMCFDEVLRLQLMESDMSVIGRWTVGVDDLDDVDSRVLSKLGKMSNEFYANDREPFSDYIRFLRESKKKS